MFKKIFLLVIVIAITIIAYNHELLYYAYGQAKGQCQVLFQAKPIDFYLKDKNFPDSLKAKIRLIQEIRQFAFDSLGIKHSTNYTTMYEQHHKPILWMLTACEPFELKAKEWKFPLLGTFSYKGFFDTTKAVSALSQLKKEGYDVDVGEVSGWSTLGWLKDPILSSMLYKKEGNLANLIIHELTHGTLYVKNNVDYNENLASFVGDQGALRFLKYKYGIDSKQYTEYVHFKTDYKKFVSIVLKASLNLDRTYKAFPKDMTNVKKLEVKHQFIADFKQSFDTISFLKPKRFEKSVQQDSLMNNTFFLHFVRYRKQQDFFEQEFKTKFNADFKKYFAFLKQKYPQGLLFSNIF